MNEKKGGSRLAQFKFVLLLALIVLALIIIFQNVRTVRYQLLFQEVELPLFLLPLAAFVAGLVAGAFISHLLRRR